MSTYIHDVEIAFMEKILFKNINIHYEEYNYKKNHLNSYDLYVLKCFVICIKYHTLTALLLFANAFNPPFRPLSCSVHLKFYDVVLLSLLYVSSLIITEPCVRDCILLCILSYLMTKPTK